MYEVIVFDLKTPPKRYLHAVKTSRLAVIDNEIVAAVPSPFLMLEPAQAETDGGQVVNQERGVHDEVVQEGNVGEGELSQRDPKNFYFACSVITT